MQPNIIKNALAFLERTQLTGKEVPAFAEVVFALNTELQAATTPAPSDPSSPLSTSNVPKHASEV